MDYITQYIDDAKTILDKLDKSQLKDFVALLVGVREQGGRLFILGCGGSAGNASHAVNDFRKIGGLESYAPTDNVSELTARINDNGWDSCFADWLVASRFTEKDALMILSVGGGNLEKNVSPNLVKALQLAQEKKAKICGIVSRDGGYTAQVADVCVIVPTMRTETVTPHAEAFQAVVWHMLVSHPEMQKFGMKWETTK